MVADYHKQICMIKYNYLTLPKSVQFRRGDRIEYVYDAAGVKRQTKHKIANRDLNYPYWSLSEPASSDFSQTTTTDYIGNKIYVNSQLKYILTEEGYIEKTGNNTYAAYYYVNDHLGNHRIVMDASGNVKQVNNYYPSGMLMAERRTDQGVQPYKFGGKEMDRTFGLDFYDFEARAYDPVLMRFNRPDPLAEKYYSISPYAYCLNNPLRYIDPTGEIPTPIEGAIIAGHIYNGKIGETLQGKWTLDKLYTSKESASYRAGLYSRTVDGVTEYAFANAGTYPELTKRGLSSIKEDLTQPFGASVDMEASLSDARAIDAELGKAVELTFVGHSKGGAEAAGNAVATKRNALLYNPAAISSSTKGLDFKSYTGTDKNGMTAYIVKGDFLDGINLLLFSKPIDKAIYLPQQSASIIINHTIESMIKALQEYYKTNQ